MATTDDFFDFQSPASKIKAKIVSDYFKAWSMLMIKRSPKLFYVDLYCGPGKYSDGNKSTPLLVTEFAIAKPKLAAGLQCLFNDRSEDNIDALEKNLSELPNIDKLTLKPWLTVGEIEQDLVDIFAAKDLVPTFSFLDPFGYKGLTVELVDALAKHWGSDMVLFFSFDSINRALTNPKVKKHIDALFGGEAAADDLRKKAQNKNSKLREEIVVEGFISGLRKRRYKHVLPYVFEREGKDRTSHYIMFISKHELGFSIMKQIMYAQSEEKIQGVARFGKVNSVGKQTPLLAFINTPLDDLCDALCKEFAGETITRKALCANYERKHPSNPFVEKNFRDALLKLEDEGRIECQKPRDKRRFIKGKPTFGPDVLVTFPSEG